MAPAAILIVQEAGSVSQHPSLLDGREISQHLLDWIDQHLVFTDKQNYQLWLRGQCENGEYIYYYYHHHLIPSIVFMRWPLSSIRVRVPPKYYTGAVQLELLNSHFHPAPLSCAHGTSDT